MRRDGQADGEMMDNVQSDKFTWIFSLGKLIIVLMFLFLVLGFFLNIKAKTSFFNILKSINKS